VSISKFSKGIINKKSLGTAVICHCPSAIANYTKHVSVINHTHHIATLYKLNKKTEVMTKGSFRMLVVAVHYSFVVFRKTKQVNPPLIQYI